MDALDSLFTPHLDTGSAAAMARIGLATILGMLLGIDREFRRKAAGLRSHMMVSLAAALLTILTFKISEGADQLGEAVQADPVRIIEAVVAGIAFLGAGAIIQGRDKVKGVTTGASLWLAGALGVACGSGAYGLAIFSTALGLVVLYVLGKIEEMAKPAIEAANGGADTPKDSSK
jgi:putative Mg2+ transporter-C (MgtC) family protein